MRILVASDKFKGSLSAVEATRAIGRGLARAVPEATIDCCPIADGGEGFMEAMASAMEGRWIHHAAVDALGRAIESRYFLADDEEGPVAVIEMAETAGMWRLSRHELDPLRATTRGVGMQIVDAMKHSVRRVVLGLGGSATNDAGCGMAAELGAVFLDQAGRPITPEPRNLKQVVRVERSASMNLPAILAACDVDNPLLGPGGATSVFSPQKGATEADQVALEAGLEQLVSASGATRHSDLPGAGAAGGLGFGLLHFAKAELKPGFDLVAEVLKLDERIRDADWVVTGEGALDRQSLGGKAPVALARLAANFGIPTAAFCGHIEGEAALSELFADLRALSGLGLPEDQLMSEAETLLEDLAASAPPGRGRE